MMKKTITKKIIFFSSLIFCLSSSFLWAQYPPIEIEWQTCQLDNECTAGVVCCECWQPVNKKYLKKIANIYNQCSGECDASCSPDLNQPVTTCINEKCEAMYQQERTNYSIEQWEKDIGFKTIIDNNLSKQAVAILKVEAKENAGVCEKYCSQKVRIIRVLQNKSDYIFPKSIDVYSYSWKTQVPLGISVIYLEKYNLERNDLWKLVDDGTEDARHQSKGQDRKKIESVSSNTKKVQKGETLNNINRTLDTTNKALSAFGKFRSIFGK